MKEKKKIKARDAAQAALAQSSGGCNSDASMPAHLQTGIANQMLGEPSLQEPHQPPVSVAHHPSHLHPSHHMIQARDVPQSMQVGAPAANTANSPGLNASQLDGGANGDVGMHHQPQPQPQQPPAQQLIILNPTQANSNNQPNSSISNNANATTNNNPSNPRVQNANPQRQPLATSNSIDYLGCHESIR